MDYFLLAQIVGFIGYGIYAISGRFQTKKKIVSAEVLGSQVCGLHWFMLGEMMPVYTNLLNGLNGIASIYVDRFPILKYLNYLTFPILMAIYFLIVGVSAASSINLLCAALFLGSRFFDNLVHLRLINIVAGIAVLVLGLVTYSLPSIIFGLSHACVHISKLIPSKTVLVADREIV